MWMGNTERFSEIIEGHNDTWINMEKAVKANAAEIASSTMYAIAAILENVSLTYFVFPTVVLCVKTYNTLIYLL